MRGLNETAGTGMYEFAYTSKAKNRWEIRDSNWWPPQEIEFYNLLMRGINTLFAAPLLEGKESDGTERKKQSSRQIRMSKNGANQESAG